MTYDFNDPELKESMEQLKIAMEKYKHLAPTINQLVNCYRPYTLTKCSDNDNESVFT